MLISARRRAYIAHAHQALPTSVRWACAALDQHRPARRNLPRGREDEHQLREDLAALAR